MGALLRCAPFAGRSRGESVGTALVAAELRFPAWSISVTT